MVITPSLNITLHNDGTISYQYKANWGTRLSKSDSRYDSLHEIYLQTKHYNAVGREALVDKMIKTKRYPNIFGGGGGEGFSEETPETVTPVAPVPEMDTKEKLIRGLNNLMSFFSEFAFEPSFRFTNTLAWQLQVGNKNAKDYINHYFSLMDSSYKDEIKNKMCSKEFDSILADIAQYGIPTNTINNRFKIYFGSAGTGKTTLGMTETDNRCVVCNSSMLPADLMEDFVFTDGNPDFKPSILWDCMENGKTIVLDEINLLPFDSLRFLQGIVDGKSEFSYKNRPVHIAEGFQIIGTMNLTIGGMSYGLPEPLVDRCCDIREFKLSAEQLANAIM